MPVLHKRGWLEMDKVSLISASFLAARSMPLLRCILSLASALISDESDHLASDESAGMSLSLTTPVRYQFRLSGPDVANGQVVLIDPRSPSRTSENDPALGPQEAGARCITCMQDPYHCPGHIGAIKVYPIPVPVAREQLTQWLSIACSECGRIGMSIDDRRSTLARRGSIGFRDIQQALQSKGPDYLCPFCSKPFRVLRPVGFPVRIGFGITFDASYPALYFFASARDAGTAGAAGVAGAAGAAGAAGRAAEGGFEAGKLTRGKRRGKAIAGGASERDMYSGMDLSSAKQSSAAGLPIADNGYVWGVLKNAVASDVEMMGWNATYYHPRDFMTDHIPIAPPAARPRPSSAARYSGGRTHKLHSIIIECQRKIIERLGSRSLAVVQREMVMARDIDGFQSLVLDIFYLYYAVTALQTRLPDHLAAVMTKEFVLGNQQDGLSYVGMLRQKGGFLRKLVAAARHNVNIRTPLTAFTYGAIGTATCPLEFAMKICVERMVTPMNIELMRALVRNGPNVYPGANAYRKAGSRSYGGNGGGRAQYTITPSDSEAIAASLVPGDVVMRHVLTGDIALHQRYPSIREESINAVMLVVDPGKLVRIPLAGCGKMMADFDGDDTELFFVSSYGVAAESLYLTSVIRQLIAPIDGKPCIGTGGDSGTDVISGITLLRKRSSFTQAQINAMFNEAFTDVSPPLLASGGGGSGFSFSDLVSSVLPSAFYFDGAASGDAQAGDLLIEGGRIVKGSVTSKGFEVLGGKSSYITRAIATSLDPYSAIKVLEDVTRICYRANTIFGWSISDDLRMREPHKSVVDKLVADRVADIDRCCNRFHNGELTVPIGQDPLDYFERMVVFKLASKNAMELFEETAHMMSTTRMQLYDYLNAFKARIITILISRGQVTVDQQRLRPVLDHGTRHSIWYMKGCDNAESGGYIRHSYVSRLTPTEFFSEAIPSRKEVFAKGRELSVQGYFTRKASTSLGPVHIGYLGEERGHSDTIIDFYYGHLGSDPRCSLPVRIDDHIVSDAEFKRRHGAVSGEYEELKRIREEWREAIAAYAVVTSNERYDPCSTSFSSPFDLNALIMRYASGGSSGGSEKKLSSEEMWTMLKTVPDLLMTVHVGKRAGGFIREIARCKIAAFMRIFRFVCCTSRLLRRSASAAAAASAGWTRSAMQRMIEAIVCKYALTLAPAGEMVGIKAAQSIIAPQTQAKLHATRGGSEVKGTISNLQRTHGTELFLEKMEGLTPQHPLSTFMLRGVMRSNLQACLDYVKRISSVRLEDVLYKAWFVSISPESLASSSDCGLSMLREYIASLPPTARRIYDQSKRSWFYIVLHIDSIRLLINHVDIAMVGKRLQMQFAEAIEQAVAVYRNRDGLFLFLSLRDESIEQMRCHFDAIVEKGVVHGHPAFSNGTIVSYTGLPVVAGDGSLTQSTAYRIMLNGSDLRFLFAQPEIDKSTILSSTVTDSASYFGIEEARFRAFEEMAFESEQMDDLSGLLRRHLKVFVDYIAYRGTLTFIPRFALGSNPDVDDLDKMTFETADNFLIDSLEQAQLHRIRGIMPCILFGVPHPFGSTISSIRLKASDAGDVTAKPAKEPAEPAKEPAKSTKESKKPAKSAKGESEVAPLSHSLVSPESLHTIESVE